VKTHNLILTFFLLLKVVLLGAQSFELHGKISAKAELEGIYVLNTTSKKFTTTTNEGRFELMVSPGDELLVGSMQYEPISLTVNAQMSAAEFLELILEDRVNALDEVVVGKILTGDLWSDIENSDAKRDINFYDVGIPGYVGPQKTQSQRKLFQADEGDFVQVYATLFGPGVSVNLHKILNRISGRTKELKSRVQHEAQNLCMTRAKTDFSAILFGDYEIEESLKFEFFLYVSEDPKFPELCQSNNSMAMFEFLNQTLVSFASEAELIND